MWTRHWLKTTIVITLIVTFAIALTNACIDLFGVFRDPTGRELTVYGDDRVAKYLLSTRYVGANFDGVLIGSSMTGNWAVGKMQSARLYNESLNGGNIVEEKVLLDRVLEQPGKTKLVLMVVHPYLTSSHGFATVNVSTRELWGALGSQNLFDAYKSVAKIRMGREEQTFDAAGAQDFGSKEKKLNPTLFTMFKTGAEFEVDPIADEHYRKAVDEIHARHIPLVFVIPPTYEGLLAQKREAFARFVQRQLGARQPEDRVLDFSAPEFAEFQNEAMNFSDGVHLRQEGAAKLTKIVDAQIKKWTDEGWRK